MAKHFHSKRKLRKKWLIEYICLFLFAYFTIKLCIYLLVDINPASLLDIENVGGEIYQKFQKYTVNNPIYLLNYEGSPKKLLPVSIETPSSEGGKRIYLYSTHDDEAYASKESILDASEYLKEGLEKENITVIKENGSISEFLKMHNYNYQASYVASRYFIESELSKASYDLIIDLHRDAINKESSTTVINGKNCARILFVVGKEHDHYQANYDLAYTLHNIVQEKYEKLSRGVLLQSGPKVNGIYNQDLSPNMILLELGGNKNTYEEVKNTIDLIVPLIGEYLNGKKI